ncbi:hypothetical protein V5N11_012583 [Cardamine amara subsp. amara]|uniref:SWIM-type domain-containing protein n=1 Tax=Cardamine amara subsp. amara TaxID=228776 RepID=A0ABD1BNA6_CARAN
MALLPMFDVIIAKVAEWFNKHRKSSGEIPHAQKLVPRVDKIMHERCKDALLLTVSELNSYHLEYSVVGLDGNTYLVDLMRKTCSCKCFDIDKYPCVHALAANLINVKGEIDVHELCSKYYWVELWALAYYQTIYPVPHQNHWIVPPEIQEKNALPPLYEKKKGRVQETRFPSVGEHRGRSRRRGSHTRGRGRSRGSSQTEGETSQSGRGSSQSGRGSTQSGRGMGSWFQCSNYV